MPFHSVGTQFLLMLKDFSFFSRTTNGHGALIWSLCTRMKCRNRAPGDKQTPNSSKRQSLVTVSWSVSNSESDHSPLSTMSPVRSRTCARDSYSSSNWSRGRRHRFMPNNSKGKPNNSNSTPTTNDGYQYITMWMGMIHLFVILPKWSGGNMWSENHFSYLTGGIAFFAKLYRNIIKKFILALWFICKMGPELELYGFDLSFPVTS